MVNYIILGLLAAVCAVSLITVITEYFVPKNSGVGRMLRAVRIRLREKSRTSFCVTAIVLLIFGLIVHGNFPKLFIALGIMLITLVILHPEDFLSIFRQRRRASKKKRLGLTPLNTRTAPAARLAGELEPAEAEPVKGNE
ncbi:hypothetical protein [Ruminococcus sp.]|uniref:hypothetical protein n=1 Tax=Ruminococcus sp. TaxID=41978 RepID=UPI0025ECFD78|nr:hypothetical protein [Ruminococcus sp.]